jgi:lauroyl/myristoyl acyltransferase
MMPMIKNVLKWFLMVPLRIVAPLVPVRMLYALARTGGRIYFVLAQNTVKKMSYEFSALTGSDPAFDVDQVVLRSCQNYISSELEVFLYRRMTSANIDAFVALEGASYLDAALAEGRGVILLHAHFGNAHMLMPALGHRGYTVNQVGLLPSDAAAYVEQVMDKRPDKTTVGWFKLKEQYEKSLPVNFIYLGKRMRPAIECLKRNEIMAISLDGVAGDMVELPFFRRKAKFLTGPVRLAKSTGAVIIPAFTVRNRNGSIRLIIEPPIKDFDTVETGAAAFVSLLEGYVRKYPCHYARLLAYNAPPFGRDT